MHSWRHHWRPQPASVDITKESPLRRFGLRVSSVAEMLTCSRAQTLCQQAPRMNLREHD